MTYNELVKLVKLINESNLAEFKMREGDFSLAIKTDKYTRSPTKIISTAPSLALGPTEAREATSVPAPPQQTAPIETTAAPVEQEKNLLEIKSPIVGTFYRASSPDKPPYMAVGDQVEPGSVVCIIEAMKLFNEIESEISGKIVKVMVENASPVEYDQVLFLVEPA
jgi:acetyl-CoA carboxylase biotin carboxyl carrier protein